ncbi:MAG TPA: glycosyltransferase [Gemmatimonadota bacterium]|nr:glycosyltransferase [Gemmatimonadota bacterium]
MTAEMSVVIATPDRYDTIRKTMQYLRNQTARDRLEIVVVAPSEKSLGLDEAELAPFASFRVVEIGEVESLAAGNAAGVRAATAPVVALLEDHSRPEKEWAGAILEAHRGDWAAVGPVMGNPNPGSAVSWADFLLGFGTWWIPTPSGEIDHLPTHNASYKRSLLLEYGPELETMLKAEIIMQWDMGARGHRLYLDSGARVYHVNFELLRSWLPVQLHAGRIFASVRSRGWPLSRRSVYALGSPLIPWIRLRHVLRQVRRRDHASLPASVYPLIAVGLLTSALGEALGYALGIGDASRSLGNYEFHRERHLRRRRPRP